MQFLLVAHRPKIAFLYKERNHLMIYKEKINFLPKCLVLNIQRFLTMVEKFLSSIKIVNHDAFIFGYTFHKLSSKVCILVFPHLQNVDDLA